MNKFKKMKFMQLGVVIVAAVAYLAILCANPVLRSRVFTDKPLLMLCTMMWALLIVTLVFYLMDIHEMLKLEMDNHELNREAYLDRLTGIPNRNSVDRLFNSYTNADTLPGVGCAVIRIADLREINDEHGHENGDRIIRQFSMIFESVGDRYGFVGRNGGNEFLAVFEKCDKEKMETFFRDLNESIEMYNGGNGNIPITIEYHYVLNSEENVHIMTDLIGRAYSKWKI